MEQQRPWEWRVWEGLSSTKSPMKLQGLASGGNRGSGFRLSKNTWSDVSSEKPSLTHLATQVPFPSPSHSVPVIPPLQP